MIRNLSKEVVPEYGSGFNVRQLERYRQFFINFGDIYKITGHMKNMCIKTMGIVIVSALASVACNGQNFLSKYPELTSKNLSAFFSDWKAYSDSVALHASKNDSLIDRIVRENSSSTLFDKNYAAGAYKEYARDDKNAVVPKYYVVPQYIKIRRYDSNVDTAKSEYFGGFELYIPEDKKNLYRLDSIIPILPAKGLYLTRNIKRVLSTYAGGLQKGDGYEEINEENVRNLRKYIPADYGHWGGYWWFTSFPLITEINYTNNLIVVMRRTSWCRGDEYWYLKEKGSFVKQAEPFSTWIE